MREAESLAKERSLRGANEWAYAARPHCKRMGVWCDRGKHSMLPAGHHCSENGAHPAWPEARQKLREGECRGGNPTPASAGFSATWRREEARGRESWSRGGVGDDPGGCCRGRGEERGQSCSGGGLSLRSCRPWGMKGIIGPRPHGLSRGRLLKGWPKGQVVRGIHGQGGCSQLRC